MHHKNRPHSLGKSVEWKPSKLCSILWNVQNVPTRWGNQLNGNPIFRQMLGVSFLVPTRWGNQLNGNECVFVAWKIPDFEVPTRWGNQSNGNLPLVVGIVGAMSRGVPTRWGNQLNGNLLEFLTNPAAGLVSPLAGEIS